MVKDGNCGGIVGRYWWVRVNGNENGRWSGRVGSGVVEGKRVVGVSGREVRV